mgnify:CR=1 FL=1
MEAQPMNTWDREAIEGRITMEELLNAIAQMGRGKSAGPDALPAEFYKSFVEIVKHDFLRVLNHALEQGHLNVSMREGDIILLCHIRHGVATSHTFPWLCMCDSYTLHTRMQEEQ